MAFRKKKEVIKYVSNTPDLQEWIRDFAMHLSTNSQEDKIQYPESFAKGYARVFQISEGLTGRIVDYTLNTDFLFTRNPAKEFYLILYLYNYKNCHRLELEINDRKIVEHENSELSSLLLTNSMVKQQLTITQNTIVKGLTIQMTEDWLKRKLKPSSKVNLKLLENKDVFQTLIKPKYRKLIDEIFNLRPDSFVPDLYLATRILRLLELFFDDIFKNGLEANVLPASTQDVQGLLNVEQYLLQNYREAFPTINTLSRLAMMSSSKLKQTFKKAFGMGLFEYFQQNRMYKARDLLLSEVYSVTEVGQLLGYHNLSNFSAAFKKEFGVLPKDAAQVV